MNKDELRLLVDENLLTSLDFYFASLMTRLSGVATPELFLAAALVSKFTLAGHTCLDLSSLAGQPLLKQNGNPRCICPELLSWRKILEQSTVVGKPGDFTPLILDNKSRLYLFRYWEYEKKLAEGIRSRVNQNVDDVDLNLLAEGLDRLFQKNHDLDTDWQKVAAATSMLKKFSVISGGPGTGKTFTVVKILTLFLEQTKNKKLRIALAAPTGKGAARLQETIKNIKRFLPCSDRIKEALPNEVFTIHRLLGSIPGSPYFRYNAMNQLPVDVMVIDEVSMVPLSLMAKVHEAIPLDAWMILLGDKDQLASVEPGSVLGDICDIGKVHLFSRSHGDMLKKVKIFIQSQGEAVPGLQDSIVHLQKSYRFEKESGITELSGAVNDGDSNRALSLLQNEHYPAITWKPLPAPKDLAFHLKDKFLSGWGKYLKTQDPKNAFLLFEQHRILCALREGPYGVRYLNFIVEQLLRREKLISPHQKWYSGRPIMVTRNDYSLGLFNGDVGIVLPDGGNSNELRAFFPTSDGNMRKLALLRLPEHETVYALTIHKSQGSEFDEVLIILPDTPGPLLTRELIYTAITRAKKRVEIWGKEAVFQFAVSSRIERTSGLRDIFWKNTEG
ncbi:MAG TPA: exodeoxyribonuclease V subunit alpha [Thermodesulfobacteriota bacterium]|nr:exodeoxyribonuclease V subunit alpha [Thermodesulfobacteriota bacterium]